QHIARCISSLKNSVDEILVIDSYSNDKTVELAESLGAKVYQNPFVNQAIQFNWALDNCILKSDWILRIDADEYLDIKLNYNLREELKRYSIDVNGIFIKRKIIFMNQPLLHGDWYPKWNLRIFRNGFGRSEVRWMDEHIVISRGISKQLEINFIDENLNSLTWWIEKHNKYSNREAIDYFLQVDKNKSQTVKLNLFGNDTERKRWFKEKYNTMPLFIRPFFIFSYRYFYKLGFLDGKSGFVWHILQGFWYRFLVDAKIFELKLKFNNDHDKIVAYIKQKFDIN
ncbi:MAG: glycosyl transferase, partial [Flavobacteriaceae bacterium CG17_big_fil_post_rev_8_21_14_2_50_31_13]